MLILFATGCGQQPEEAVGDAQQNVTDMSAEHASKHLDPSYVTHKAPRNRKCMLRFGTRCV
jgi:hypothetical protein